MTETTTAFESYQKGICDCIDRLESIYSTLDRDRNEHATRRMSLDYVTGRCDAIGYAITQLEAMKGRP